MKFRVIDNETGKEANADEIVNNEKWAYSLIYYDIDGFALLESGSLVLLDECGNFEYCPSDRFTVVFDEERKQSEGEWKPCFEDWRHQIEGDECSVCGFQHYGTSIKHYHYCPNCGARMKGGEGDG